MSKDFILASGSKGRIRLLSQIGYEPAQVIPADIDETPKKGEKPSAYVKRMALEKAKAIAAANPGKVVLGGDTIVVSGARIIQKSKSPEEQAALMKLLSSKAHRVLSAVCVVNKEGRASTRLSASRVVMKRMTGREIADYVATNEWVGIVGYSIEGAMQAYVKKIVGSLSGIVGLPLYEAKNLLNGAGIR